MNIWKWTATLLFGLAASGAWLARGADDSRDKPADDGQGACVAAAGTACLEGKKPPWKKAVADWKADKISEPADNFYCDVCHLNYKDEKLARTHQRAGVGCETCHGISDKHSEDEDNMVPPDIMFARPRIMTFCMACHEKAKLEKEEDHEDLFSKDADPDKICTDCHGKEHRLEVRTRRWDKETRKLIWSDGVQMMQERPVAAPPKNEKDGALR